MRVSTLIDNHRRPTVLTSVATGVLLAMSLLLGACASSTSRVVAPDEMRAEINTFLQEWNAAIAAQDQERIRAAYVNDGRFRWFEDGQLRYSSADEIVGALRQFPPGTQVETELSEITIEPVSNDAAVGSASFQTRIAMPGSNFEFGGVFTMLMERGGRGWVFVHGHTSTRRPADTRGGG